MVADFSSHEVAFQFKISDYEISVPRGRLSRKSTAHLHAYPVWWGSKELRWWVWCSGNTRSQDAISPVNLGSTPRAGTPGDVRKPARVSRQHANNRPPATAATGRWWLPCRGAHGNHHPGDFGPRDGPESSMPIFPQYLRFTPRPIRPARRAEGPRPYGIGRPALDLRSGTRPSLHRAGRPRSSVPGVGLSLRPCQPFRFPR